MFTKKTSKALIIFLFTCFSALIPSMARANDLCLESLGGCDPECNARCVAQHPGALSSCDATTSTCKCFFQCPSPPPPPPGKTCTDAQGLCSAKCGDNCCDQRCAAKHSGHGACHNPIPGPYTFCTCTFQCKD